MKNHKTRLFAGCLALNLFLSLAGQAQTTNICNGCTISSTYTNLTGNVYSFIGTNSSLLTGGNTTFFNQGTVQQTGSGTFLVGGFNQNVYFNNGPGAIYQFATDNVIGNDYPGNSSPVFSNQGLVWKSGGTNYSGIQTAFNNQSGVIKVDSGTLYLSGGGTSSNGVFNVASGAVLDLTGGSGPTWSGTLTGSGSGTVSLAAGSITANPSLTLDFTNSLFQWDGGTLQGTITNTGLVTLSSTNSSLLTGANTIFYNQATVQQVGSGSFLVGGFNQNVYFNNGPGAIYQFATDNVIGNNYPGNSSPVFSNQGLVWKSGGTNTSAIGASFNNQGGVVQVDSGTLTLYGGGTSSNGVFNVASGAVLDLTGGSAPTWSGEMTGSGSGQVWLHSGTLFASPALVIACPPNLLQWNGAILQGNITNTGTVTISGTNVSTLTGGNTTFVNEDTVIQSSSANPVWGTFGGNVYFFNELGAIYDFTSDSSIGFGNNAYGQGTDSAPFSNFGLVRKSGGTNTSTIYPAFINNSGGSIEVDSGVLSLYGVGYALNGGSLTIALGGPNANQCGQLAVGGPATLNGPLNVILTHGYVPVVGDQFEILSCSSFFTGTFSSTNVPAGMTVSYRHNIQSLPEYVYLVVTGTVPAQVQSPQLSGGNFTFNFGTANGQSYTVQQNTNLATTNWTFYTNIIGNGSIYQFATPVISIPRRFFRVRSP